MFQILGGRPRKVKRRTRVFSRRLIFPSLSPPPHLRSPPLSTFALLSGQEPCKREGRQRVKCTCWQGDSTELFHVLDSLLFCDIHRHLSCNSFRLDNFESWERQRLRLRTVVLDYASHRWTRTEQRQGGRAGAATRAAPFDGFQRKFSESQAEHCPDRLGRRMQGGYVTRTRGDTGLFC